MPKITSKGGYTVVSPSGWDMFAQALNQTGQIIQQKTQEAKDATLKAQQTQKEQTDFRIMLSQIGMKDPDTYNLLIDDPNVRRFMDPGRGDAEATQTLDPFAKFLYQKLQQRGAPQATPGTGPMQPTPGEGDTAQPPRAGGMPPLIPSAGITSAASASTGITTGATGPSGGMPSTYGTGSDIVVPGQSTKNPLPRMQKSPLQEKTDTAQISALDLQQKITDMRKKGLDSNSILDNIMGLTGRPATLAEVQPALLTPTQLLEQTPGTTEWKQTQARAMATDMINNVYHITDVTDQQRVQAMADFEAGLRPDRPTQMPSTYKGLEYDMSVRGEALRRQEFGLSQAQYALGVKRDTLSASEHFMAAGVDPMQALQLADSYLKGGPLPANLDMTKFKDQQEQLRQLQVDKLNLEITNLRANDPEINSMFKVLEQSPEKDRTGSPLLTQIKQLMVQKGIVHAMPASDPGWVDMFTNYFKAVGTKLVTGKGTAPAGTATASGPSRPIAPTAVAPPPKGKVSPEQAGWAGTTIELAKSEYMQTDASTRGKLSAAMKAAAAAQDNNDGAALAKAITDLQEIIRVSAVGRGVKGYGG